MIRIDVATIEDAKEISRLLTENSIDRGGKLYGDWSIETVEDWLRRDMPIIMARDEKELVGVVLTSHKEGDSSPVVAEMLRAWPGTADAYVYGPVCIARAARGTGILPRLYHETRLRLGSREAILFIQRTNLASLRAHIALGMRHVADFELDGQRFEVFTDGRG